MKFLRPKDEVPERPSPRHRPGTRLRACGLPGGISIYVSKPLLDEVVDYAGGDRQRPRGGLLFGFPGQSKGERYVELRGHLPSEEGRGEGVCFTFTHEALSEAFSQANALWPDARVAGWYYTHLGSGIFLSGQDAKLHRDFFNQWWMFALVVDPVEGTLGCFQWNKDQIVQSGFTLVE